MEENDRLREEEEEKIWSTVKGWGRSKRRRAELVVWVEAGVEKEKIQKKRMKSSHPHAYYWHTFPPFVVMYG